MGSDTISTEQVPMDSLTSGENQIGDSPANQLVLNSSDERKTWPSETSSTPQKTFEPESDQLHEQWLSSQTPQEEER